MNYRSIGLLSESGAGKSLIVERLACFSEKMHQTGIYSDSDFCYNQVTNAGLNMSNLRIGDLQLRIIEMSVGTDSVNYSAELPAIEGIVLVVPANDVLAKRSHAIWQQIKEWGVPHILFLNKIDCWLQSSLFKGTGRSVLQEYRNNKS